MTAAFSPELLVAAKNAGLPITVLIGVISVFLAVSATKIDMKGVRFLIVSVLGAVAIACLMGVFWISTRESYSWIDTTALADWGGKDEGWTDGRTPEKEKCDETRTGVLAVCWSNRPFGYPVAPKPMFEGAKRDGAWCAYKLKEELVFGEADGHDKGRVFVCARVTL
jgi:hypothetical protein